MQSATATAMHAASACTRKLAITGGQSSQQTIYYIGIREIPLYLSVCVCAIRQQAGGQLLAQTKSLFLHGSGRRQIIYYVCIFMLHL